MTVTLKLFALSRQIAGSDSVAVEIADGGTVGQLREALGRQVPKLAIHLRHLMFAVNMEYADDSEVIPPGADVACIPPVSGG
jgi:molybdopterin converting factor subunit 1